MAIPTERSSSALLTRDSLKLHDDLMFITWLYSAVFFLVAPLIHFFSGVNIFMLVGADDLDRGLLYFASPILGFVCGLLAVRRYLLLRRLLTRGEVVGVVLKLDRPYMGTQDMQYSYFNGGRAFTKKASFYQKKVSDLVQGQALPVLVDQAEPDRHVVLLSNP